MKIGLKSYILNKIKDTNFGQKNIILQLYFFYSTKFLYFKILHYIYLISLYFKFYLLIIAIIFSNNSKICKFITPWIEIITHTDKNCNLNSNCNSNSKYNCNSYCNCYSNCYFYCCNINKNNEKLYLLNKTFHNRNFYNVLYTYNYKIYKDYNNYKIKIIQNSERLNRLYHTHCRAINRIGPHNLDVISIIFGLLLGAGTAQNISGEGIRISIKKSFIHKEFLFYLYEFFLKRGYCSNIKPRKFSRIIKNINKRYDGRKCPFSLQAGT
uniref:LAGLIDADG homing endonuclease n=1 Tax=Tricholoma bakamatsutake TaxID=51221 RepID=A0A6C0W498_9AGAR|nr:LAGLIDADG homing endonuclease [Tricholoma bakamatsutake]QIC20196.1 LAGLIDADG homing endonuclease [Tricholoma bakamatsutake]